MQYSIAAIRDVIDERDARSALTMIAQVSWEKDKPYNPTPVAVVKDEQEEARVAS